MKLVILRYLLDTNVLVYLYDAGNQVKREVAKTLVRRLSDLRSAALPTQALAEFSNVALRKLNPPLDPQFVYTQVAQFETAFPIFPLTPAIVLEALRGVRDHRMSYYDAQIWAAARLAQIPIVLSEDFPSGAMIEGVRFLDPFAPGVAEVL